VSTTVSEGVHEAINVSSNGRIVTHRKDQHFLFRPTLRSTMRGVTWNIYSLPEKASYP